MSFLFDAGIEEPKRGRKRKPVEASEPDPPAVPHVEHETPWAGTPVRIDADPNQLAVIVSAGKGATFNVIRMHGGHAFGLPANRLFRFAGGAVHATRTAKRTSTAARPNRPTPTDESEGDQ